ncbi:heavy-metal-associated domain-containing protein [Microbacterium caowuchunii]|uniref:Heavy-metal-associated domain-containing protein n=1 Tax=Microbacterium caowuchunii TaxID=2614638 RepID=A0A5N0TKU3_9MICO|nr:heavy-metal-associated domain-containing protein [Microbacterium caowuchunii]KAA9135048.1 heavy-metal-associated domain-containing protein [Microbacterium caowuchunii]
MNAAGRLILFTAGLGLAFAGAFGISAAVVPEGLAAGWNEGDAMNEPRTDDATTADESAVQGLASSADGYSLSPVTAPPTVAEPGELAFRVLSADGDPLTEFTTAHDRDLHLIVVRTDGALFRHVHPDLDETTGVWSLPWEWEEAGTYRVYADFTPGDSPAGVVLTRTVEVAGPFAPVVAEPVSETQVDGFTVVVTGDLAAGTPGELTLTVEQDGTPVTSLQPYLGAFGHLVALREGDMAYLHAHPQGAAPEPGSASGPEVSFMVNAPTAGRYLLYFDFEVDGRVHSAPFVVDVAPGDAAAPAPHDAPHGH